MHDPLSQTPSNSQSYYRQEDLMINQNKFKVKKQDNSELDAAYNITSTISSSVTKLNPYFESAV